MLGILLVFILKLTTPFSLHCRCIQMPPLTPPSQPCTSQWSDRDRSLVTMATIPMTTPRNEHAVNLTLPPTQPVCILYTSQTKSLQRVKPVCILYTSQTKSLQRVKPVCILYTSQTKSLQWVKPVCILYTIQIIQIKSIQLVKPVCTLYTSQMKSLPWVEPVYSIYTSRLQHPDCIKKISLISQQLSQPVCRISQNTSGAEETQSLFLPWGISWHLCSKHRPLWHHLNKNKTLLCQPHLTFMGTKDNKSHTIWNQKMTLKSKVWITHQNSIEFLNQQVTIRHH